MNLGFFVQKWPFRDAQLFFKKNSLKPLFYSVFSGARFLGQGVKNGEILRTHQK